MSSLNFDDDPFGAPASTSSSSSAGLDDFDMSVPASVSTSSAAPQSPFDFQAPPAAGPSPSMAAPPAVDTPLSQWQTERRQVLISRMAKAAEQKRELATLARNELEKFYSDRQSKIARNQGNNRTEEKNFKDEMAHVFATGSDWEKVAKLCDLKGKGSAANSEAARIRSVMIELKNDKPQAASSSKSAAAAVDSFF